MNIDKKRIIESINKSCVKLGECEIGGTRLETGSPQLFDVREGEFDEHVAMQPSAIAYFGVLRKQSERQLLSLKNNYEKWKKKKFHETKRKLETQNNKKKFTIADVDSSILIDNEQEIEDWENSIMELQEQYDTFDVWYSAWRQKSFSLKEHGQTMSDEKKINPYIMEKNDQNFEQKEYNKEKGNKSKHESSIDRIRQMRKNKGNNG